MRRAVAVLVLVGCHHAPAPAPIVVPPPVPASTAHATVAELARFEVAWQAVQTCLTAPLPPELAGLDPRDAIPLVREVDREEGACLDWKALAAALPPNAADLRAVVTPLEKLWGATAYGDDTGSHMRFDDIAVFANALRDADDARVAERRAAGLPATALGTRRLPVLERRAGTGTLAWAGIAEAPPIEHVAQVSDGYRDHARETVSGDRGAQLAWTAEVTRAHDLVVHDGGVEIVVAHAVPSPQEVEEIGAGDHRAIVVRGSSDFTIYTSADTGWTWRVDQAKLDAVQVPGDPRGADLVAASPRRWIHIGPDGIVMPPVPIGTEIKNAMWSCATPAVLWNAVGQRNDTTILAWFDRAGRHGEVPFAGSGGWGCAGTALLAQARCTTDRARCGDAPSLFGMSDLAADGVVAAGTAGDVILIERTGAHPFVHYARMPEHAALAKVLVVGDTPTFALLERARPGEEGPPDDPTGHRGWQRWVVHAYVEGQATVAGAKIDHRAAVRPVIAATTPAPHAEAFVTAWDAARECLVGRLTTDPDLARARAVQIALGAGSCAAPIAAALAVAREGAEADAGYHLAWHRAGLAIAELAALDDDTLATRLPAVEATFAGAIGGDAPLALGALVASHVPVHGIPPITGELVADASGPPAIDHAVAFAVDRGGKRVVLRATSAGITEVAPLTPPDARALVHAVNPVALRSAARATGIVDVVWQPAAAKGKPQPQQWLAIDGAKPPGAPQVIGAGAATAMCGTAAGLWWIDEGEGARVMFSAAHGATRSLGALAARGGEVRACTQDDLVVAVAGEHPALVRCDRARAACDAPIAVPGLPGTRVFADVTARGELRYAIAIGRPVGGMQRMVIGGGVVDIAGEVVGAAAFAARTPSFALVVAGAGGIVIEDAP